MAGNQHVAEQQHGAEDSEELSCCGDHRASQWSEASNHQKDEELSQRATQCNQRQMQPNLGMPNSKLYELQTLTCNKESFNLGVKWLLYLLLPVTIMATPSISVLQ